MNPEEKRVAIEMTCPSREVIDEDRDRECLSPFESMCHRSVMDTQQFRKVHDMPKPGVRYRLILEEVTE